MKLYVLMPIVGMVAIAPIARAASPTENECDAASAAAKQLRSAGSLSAARARLPACLSTGCSSLLREDCVRQLAAIDEAMPAVVLEVRDEASNSVNGVRVTMDGAPVLDRLDGTAILVDPGQHRVVFEAAGFRRTEATFVAHERQKKLRVVVFLASAASLSPAPSTGSDSPAAAESDGDDERTSLANRRQNIGLVLGAAGIAGVVVGTIWSIMAKVTYDHALTSECSGDTSHCSSQGIADGQRAHHQATIATVGFVAAGALFAAGAVLYFRTPKTGVAVAPAIYRNGDLRNGGLTVVGNW